MTEWYPHKLQIVPTSNVCSSRTACDSQESARPIHARRSKIVKSSTIQQQKRTTRSIKQKVECVRRGKKRERTRHDNVNIAFGKLRDILPTYPPDKKLSKCQILKLAVRYISLLTNVLKELSRPESLTGKDTC